MKIIGTTFEKLPRERLVIGFEGENLRATVRIDCASVFVEYPNATPALTVKPLFADAYPVVVDRNGTCVDWLITSEILSFTGDGEIQLTFVKDQVICKSAIAKIRVCRSLQVTGDMPDPVAQWVDDANAKLAEVDAQIVELEGMVDTATDAATRAEQSASTASAEATSAAGSAATATAKATEATNAAGTATAKAAEAQTAANAAAESERIATAKAGEATTAAGTATAKAEQATEAAQTATEKAGDASASARAAQTSATDAASSATAASASETAAKASETAAGASASQAAQSAQTASTAAQTATQKATEATQSASNAATSATNAATSAETASTKAGEAAQSAQAASDAKTAVEETAEQLADSLEQIEQNTQDIAELDERKANIDGYYPDMTVGNAEQLNSSKYVENSEPYTLRTSGGSADIGNREYLDAVVGGSLPWNQLAHELSADYWYTNQTASAVFNGGVAEVSFTAQYAQLLMQLATAPDVIANHRYLLTYDAKVSGGDNQYRLYCTSGMHFENITPTTNYVRHGAISTVTRSVSKDRLIIQNNASSDWATLFIKNVCFFDLTQMFGTAVADYLYNLETATAGAGVALFRSWFPKDYYEYNPGELRHVEGLQSHDMVGFNLLEDDVISGTYPEYGNRIANEKMERLIPQLAMLKKLGQTLCYRVDSNRSTTQGIPIGSVKFAVNGTIIAFTMIPNIPFVLDALDIEHITGIYVYGANPAASTTLSNACINLSHNGSRNGEYEPYEKHSYPLDSTVVLRGIPKVGTNGVYWDGDRYLPDGTVERRYGVVDLGTLTWNYNTQYHLFYSGGIGLTAKANGLCVCNKYRNADTGTDSSDKLINIGRTGWFVQTVNVRDSMYTDPAAFKAAMSGVYLVYELATPTTETAQPYHSTQWVSDWGTEEFVSTGIVPVGHETRYPANLRDKLQHLPDAASGNGSYLITQTDGQMVLTPFPAPPSTAGNYVLKATVTNGVATYTWEVAT